ncbi:MAG TPA: UrcA family protein [Sphingomonas sp.]|uniref:UrcA family protein n=1 Tax=Sphingomonas sp. TaxID=28214 RepID=UPI002C81673A|nr:UrcA family protein [Sphingomonas sp.]HMI18533.1 UrcA family protein [Sphingomonas sp.]
MRIPMILAAVALTTATISAPAFAGRPEMPQARIGYADLDLGNARDVAKLQHRVAIALESVCGSYAGADPVEANDIAKCRNAAAAKAQPMVAMLIEHERGVALAQR